MRRAFPFLTAIIVSAIASGCGGGGGAISVPATPGFTVSLSSSTITVNQGGTQNLQVSVAAHDGFSGPVLVSAPAVPAGVSVSPSSLSLTPGSSSTFTFTASKTAGIVQQPSLLEAVAGSLAVETAIEFSVNGPAVPDPFHVIGGEIVHGFYDPARQLLFASNPGLNEIDVVSGVDFSVRARVSAPQPWGIDQMADNKTLVIGTAAQQILTLDEDTLVVTQHPVSLITHTLGLFYPNPVALANGKVLIIGQEQGIESGDIQDGGQFVVEWDSIGNTFQVLRPLPGQLGFETDRLARSGDHKWAIFSADQFYLYSSDADTLTTAPLSTVNPPVDSFGVRGYATNADGTVIGVASAEQVTFLDRSFNLLGTAQIPSAFQSARTIVTFTPDGSRLLLQYALPTAIEVVDANQHTALGYYTAILNPQDNSAKLIGLDSSVRAFVGTSGGILAVDMTQPIIPNDPGNQSIGAAFCALPAQSTIPLNVAVQGDISLSSGEQGTSFYFGGQPAPVLANGTKINIPSSSIAGPVDIECIGPSGKTFMEANSFSYGVDTIGMSASLLPPNGNAHVTVFGYGFSSAGNPPVVTVGGQATPPPQILSVLDSGVLQAVDIHVPNASGGHPADVNVSSANGSSTLTQAATYIPSSTIIPAKGLLQVLYDTHRNLLYALKAGELATFNPATLQFQSVVPLPGLTGAGNYNVMALSPDGTRLIASSPDGYVAVLDPSSPASVSVVATNLTAGVQTGSVAVTKFNKAVITGFPTAVQVDLATLAVTVIHSHLGSLVRASADGNFLYGVDLNTSNGEVYAINPVTYSTQSESFGFLFWTDLAVSPDGSQATAIFGFPNAFGDLLGFFDASRHLLNTNVYPLVSPPRDVLVLGSVYSPQGKVLLTPLGNSIEFWDAASGTLRARLATPEELPVLAFPEGPEAPQMAVDSTGQTIFAISATGLTVLGLPQPVDTMPAKQWAVGAATPAQKGAVAAGIKARVSAMRSTKSK